jgi:dephospho-CoA kinase
MPNSTHTHPCLKVGVTGGIGSGKTMVCQMLHSLGAPVYYADHWAKWLLTHDAELKARIAALFGPDAYGADGSYQRQYVAAIAFAQPEKLAALNALVHPRVLAHGEAWHLEQAAKGVAYTLKEAALLVESGSHQHLDFLIVVTAPEALRLQRVQQRDGLSEADVRARMARQLPEAEKIKLADFVIHNDGLRPLIPQVWAAHQRILQRRADTAP